MRPDTSQLCGGGHGSGSLGEEWAVGVREEGVEEAGSGRNKGKLHTIAQYFAIEKAQRGGSQQKIGREQGLKGTGSEKSNPLDTKPPSSPPKKAKQII